MIRDITDQEDLIKLIKSLQHGNKDMINESESKNIIKQIDNIFKEHVSENKQKSTSNGRWTQKEHQLFIKGINDITKGLIINGRDWKRVSRLIGTRSGTQIRSHAQKFFNRIKREHNISDPDTYIKQLVSLRETLEKNVNHIPLDLPQSLIDGISPIEDITDTSVSIKGNYLVQCLLCLQRIRDLLKIPKIVGLGRFLSSIQKGIIVNHNWIYKLQNNRMTFQIYTYEIFLINKMNKLDILMRRHLNKMITLSSKNHFQTIFPNTFMGVNPAFNKLPEKERYTQQFQPGDSPPLAHQNVREFPAWYKPYGFNYQSDGYMYVGLACVMLCKNNNIDGFILINDIKKAKGRKSRKIFKSTHETLGQKRKYQFAMNQLNNGNPEYTKFLETRIEHH